MSPLSAIPNMTSIYGMMPRVEAMPAELPGVQGPGAIGQTDATHATKGPGDSFGSVFTRMVDEVNAKQMAAGDAVRGLESGQNVSLHQTMIAMEEANVSFQLMVEVRNKMLEAYQEVMRMQV